MYGINPSLPERVWSLFAVKLSVFEFYVGESLVNFATDIVGKVKTANLADEDENLIEVHLGLLLVILIKQLL